jgi:hypothetical protein
MEKELLNQSNQKNSLTKEEAESIYRIPAEEGGEEFMSITCTDEFGDLNNLLEEFGDASPEGVA